MTTIRFIFMYNGRLFPFYKCTNFIDLFMQILNPLFFRLSASIPYMSDNKFLWLATEPKKTLKNLCLTLHRFHMIFSRHVWLRDDNQLMRNFCLRPTLSVWCFTTFQKSSLEKCRVHSPKRESTKKKMRAKIFIFLTEPRCSDVRKYKQILFPAAHRLSFVSSSFLPQTDENSWKIRDFSLPKDVKLNFFWEVFLSLHHISTTLVYSMIILRLQLIKWREIIYDDNESFCHIITFEHKFSHEVDIWNSFISLHDFQSQFFFVCC